MDEPQQAPAPAPLKRPAGITKKKQKHHSFGQTKITILAAAVLIFIAMSAGFVGGWLGSSSKSNGNLSTNVEEGRQVVAEQSNLISTLAKEVGPSVVSVDVTSQRTTSNSFFGPQTSEQQSAGTGFIISESGYVVTNRHVIPDGTKQVNLTLSDGTVLDEVTVVGKTSDSDPLDVAFLKINNTKGVKLTVAKLGDSSKMQVGESVIAIGNALGQFQNSVTSGIISGYGRSVQASDGTGQNAESLQNLFQTDAAINQGNSGGPLVNMNGEVIGINTAVAGGDAQNIGFSIPINDAKGLVQGVLASGELKRPYLGVQYVQLTPAAAEELGLSINEGAYINDSNGNGVIGGSPAAKAGLQAKDVITKINDQTVDANNTLASVIGRFKVGEKVTVTYIRDGQTKTAQVTIGELPAN
jgi:serine protease Do